MISIRLTLTVALLAPSLCAQKDWVQRGGAQRTGYFPGGLKEAKRSKGAKQLKKEKQLQDAKHPKEKRPEERAPMVFVADGGNGLLGLDLATGKKKWSYRMGSWCQSDPIVSRGILYVGSSAGHLHAVHAASGKPVFKKKLGKDGYYFDGTGAAAVSGGILYVGLAKDTTGSARAMKGRYVAIQLKTGRFLWSKKI